jgi:transketolase C-terminal domain/subunit
MVSDVTDFMPFLVFLYGSLAGFLIFRLGRQNELRAGEERVLVAAGWTMTALSLTLAAALILFAISRSVYPIA